MVTNLLENWHVCEIFKFIAVGIFVSFIDIFGAFLNIIAIISFLLQKKKNSTIFMLIGLEIADTLFLLSHFMIISIVSLTRYSLKLTSQKYSIFDSPQYINLTQKFIVPILTAALMASSWHVTLLTIERYIAICHPHKASKITKKNTLIAQVILYIFVFSINSVNGLESEAEYLKERKIWIAVETKLKRNKIFSALVTSQYFIFQLILPVLTTIILTIFIMKRIRKTKMKKSDFTKPILVVNFIFTTAQFINAIARILLHFIPINDLTSCKNFFSYLFESATVLLALNASINFFIYVLYNKLFRQRVKKIWAFATRSSNRIGSRNTSSFNISN